ncbi:hypothetical protein BLTE_15980 [Blastochloris tepida]|uniref:HTH cro/C1-type domain-containing protein n=1 Tax=Blastochloris tepida TaxID=2233851 RepID=A0A348G030_9HYPH|nr:hypothetical protein BLTE_15980 [Blastochloris tepida]
MHQIEYRFGATIDGSEELYRAVRAALVARGTSLNALCKARGLNRQTVERALKGERHSKLAAKLRKELANEILGAEGER